MVGSDFMKFPFKKYENTLVSTLIAEDCHIKGTIHSQQSIRIDGSFEGEINSQGEIVVGEKGKVKATLIAKTVIIAGEVTGNIEAIKGLYIRKTGKVYGDVSGDQLFVEEGGLYRGKVNMDVVSSRPT